MTLFNLNRYPRRKGTHTLWLRLRPPARHISTGARTLIALKRLDEAEKDLKRAIEIGGDDVKVASSVSRRHSHGEE
jgi:hypothetical protein